MKVRVNSNMTIYGVFHPPLELELDASKNELRDLLDDLNSICESVEFATEDEIGSDVQKVLVNNEECFRLDTALHEGDDVNIIIEMAPLGGG